MSTIAEMKAELASIVDRAWGAHDPELAEFERQAAGLHQRIRDAERNEKINQIGRGTFSLAAESPLSTALRTTEFDAFRNPEVRMGSVLLKASSFPGDTTEELPSVRGPFVGLGFDNRYVYPALPQDTLGDNLAVSEYVETSPPSTSGNVERDPMDSSNDKATMEVSIDFAAEKASQLAIVVEGVPNAVLTSFQAFQGVINDRMQRELNEAADAHVLSQIDAAGPDSTSGTGDPIADLRNAVGSMRAAGANPTIAAVNPDDAAALDLTQVGADSLYLFTLRASGQASPLFGLRLIEAKNVPQGTTYVIDPQTLGIFYTGPSRFLADPYSNMKKNLTSLRLEQTALFHVRNVQGAFVIGGTS